MSASPALFAPRSGSGGGVRAAIMSVLERIAPLRLAAKWDNVGLLVDGPMELLPQPLSAAGANGAAAAGAEAAPPFRVMLTNDVTLSVLEEALAARVQLLVSYHPTPFTALRRFDESGGVAARVVLAAARGGLAVYSPHTALDCAPGGLNDKLLGGLLEQLGFPAAWGPCASRAPAAPLAGGAITPAADKADAEAGAGDGRWVSGLTAAAAATADAQRCAVTLTDVVAAVKAHLRVSHVLVALPRTPIGPDAAAARAASEHVVDSIAVAAGSGASVFGARTFDVLVTGEMSHHEVLAATARGAAVILTRHSASERFYLPTLAQALRDGWARESAATIAVAGALPAIDVCLAATDAEPLLFM